MTVCEDPPTKVFGGGEIGVDAKGDGKGPPTKLFGEGPRKKRCFGEGPPKKSSFGGGNVGEVIEDGGEAHHVKGDANVCNTLVLSITFGICIS